MRLGVDVRKLGDGGIGTYVRETLMALAALAPEIDVVAFAAPGTDRAALPLGRLEWREVDAGKYSLAEHWRLPTAVRAARVDVFHEPHYVLPLLLSGPAVVTVHDLIHLLLPRTPVHAEYARFVAGSACRRAARVIAVSETTADDLVRHLDVPRTKIRVVPNGVSPRFRPLPADELARGLAALGVERPYVLFVGNVLPHKNVGALVDAWRLLPEPRPALVLCGRGYDEPALARRIFEAGPAVRVLDAVPSEGLVPLYGGAELLASATLHEGFCLPLVEAFACGTPVVAAAAGAIPEVAGDAALLVPPQRVDLLAEGMYRLLRDQELRRGLAERGLRRAARFSWQAAAHETLAVYREITSP